MIASSDPPTDPSGEFVEVIGADGTIERIVTRGEMRRERLRHRTVFIAVIDARGRLLVHQRSPDKDVWPGRWDLAAGGVVAVGETWSAAAERELAEELGLVGELVRLGSGSFEDTDVSEVAEVFVIRSDGPVQFDDGEVVDARWVDRHGVQELLSSASMCPDSVQLVLPLIESMLAG